MPNDLTARVRAALQEDAPEGDLTSMLTVDARRIWDGGYAVVTGSRGHLA